MELKDFLAPMLGGAAAIGGVLLGQTKWFRHSRISQWACGKVMGGHIRLNREPCWHCKKAVQP